MTALLARVCADWLLRWRVAPPPCLSPMPRERYVEHDRGCPCVDCAGRL